jgi:ketosteroid isomerase-like protein
MRGVRSLGGAVVALLAACQTQETPQQMQARMSKESDAFRQAIAGTAKRWEGWIAAGQADSIASVFMEQGREMPPNAPAAVGRASIRQFEAQNAAMLDGKLTIKTEEALANGPLGIERGSFSFEGKAKPGAPKGMPATVSDEGKYLIHWHNMNGQWRVAELIWNSNKPMMMAPPAAQQKPAAAKAKKTPRRK